MDYPMEIAHIEEIEEEIEEDQEAEEIIIAQEEEEATEPAQQFVLVKSAQGITRAVRVQPAQVAATPPPPSTVQYIKTESGELVQVRTARAEPSPRFVQRVATPQKQVLVKGAGNQQYVMVAQPKVVTASSPQYQLVQPGGTKKTITLAQAQQLGLIKGNSPAGTKIVTLNPTIRNDQPLKTVNTPQRVVKVAHQMSNPSTIKMKPVTGDSPRVIQISGGGQAAIQSPRIKTEQNVQYVEVVQSPEGPSPSVRVLNVPATESHNRVPTYAFKNKYYKSSVGQKAVMIQQRSTQKALAKEEEDVKWKVSRSTAEALVQLEGSVVIPGVGTSKIVMLPSDYVDKISSKDQEKTQTIEEPPADTGSYSVIVDESEIVYQPGSPVPGLSETIKKRPCNCTKSQCLKLYCECFANGEFCSNCNCKECFNTMEYEDERQAAIYNCLERNPNAFRPKIGQVGTDADVRHHKGCNCKRSGCLKNYCECFEAKISCSSACKCKDCKNSEEHFERLHLAPTAKVGNKRVLTLEDVKGEEEEPQPKQPYNFMTADVVDATVQCMMAQADECQQKGLGHQTTEMLILEEFGRCLAEIIDFSNKNATE